ncbi:MAG: ISL3 family transposase [Staphylococcus equorum]|nr:ISL3 family transposase [Staphylococcus equorum]
MTRITLPIAGVQPTYLCLKKQRFVCKACDSSFTAQTPLVKKGCFISEHTKAKVVIKSAEAQSITSIASDCLVSPTTVQRVITKEAKVFKPHHHALPKHLSFDEFKYAKGRMAFEYIDAETGDIIDILDQRDSRTLKNHFIANYHFKDLKKVETVTIDMNAGYVNVIKEVLPQAKIIIDRFHIVQLINRSMNKCRVRIMNLLKTSNGEDMKKYRRLKRYWKLILKKESELSYTEYKYYPLFGQRLEVSIVEEMLGYNDELKANYMLYQQLLRAISDRDFKALENTLQKPSNHPMISSFMKTSLKTLKKHLPYIKNSFTFPFNNGRIEGINNKIKVLNRVAYGYRNFTNYKNRIMLHFKLRPIIQKPKAKANQKETHYKAA